MTQAVVDGEYGGPRTVRRNVFLYFMDGVTFQPSTALISMTTVIPLFFEQVRATTVEFAIATAIVSVCTFVSQPVFVSICSRVRRMGKSFAWILFAQRAIFLAFVVTMPLLAGNPSAMIWVFLASWAVFNLMAGSGTVFNVPLVLKLLPPDKRAGMRGVGFAIGNVVSLGMAALIPVIIDRLAFPQDFMVLFGIGLLFLFANAAGFWFMDEGDDVEPRHPVRVTQYVRAIPATLVGDPVFRAMVGSCVALVVANSLIPFYTLHAIRDLSASEAQVSLLAALAIVTAVAVNLVFGFFIDRRGPVKLSSVAAVAVTAAGIVGLVGNSLPALFVAWVLANLGNACYMQTTMLMLGDVSPQGKAPLYVGILFSISTLLSSVLVLALAPVLETVGFGALFVLVTVCGAVGWYLNVRVFQPRLAIRA
jgi:MFS family permease